MRWRTVWVDVSPLAVLTGCPRNHMPGGVLDRAAHKDVKQLLEEYDCSEEEFNVICQGRTDIEACLKECAQ